MNNEDTKTDDFACCSTKPVATAPEPDNLGPHLIGHTISLQSFPYDQDREPGTIDVERMEKFVGILVAYAITDGVITFVIEGFEDPFFIDTAVRHYEIYV